MAITLNLQEFDHWIALNEIQIGTPIMIYTYNSHVHLGYFKKLEKNWLYYETFDKRLTEMKLGFIRHIEKPSPIEIAKIIAKELEMKPIVEQIKQ